MHKHSKEYCEERIEEIRTWFTSCIVGLILSVIAMHLFDGIIDTISAITIGLGILFLVGIMIEKSKCKNILEELHEEDKSAS